MKLELTLPEETLAQLGQIAAKLSISDEVLARILLVQAVAQVVADGLIIPAVTQ